MREEATLGYRTQYSLHLQQPSPDECIIRQTGRKGPVYIHIHTPEKQKNEYAI